MQRVRVRPLVEQLRTHRPHGQKPKTLNGSSIVGNSLKTLKTAHIKKILKELIQLSVYKPIYIYICLYIYIYPTPTFPSFSLLLLFVFYGLFLPVSHKLLSDSVILPQPTSQAESA